MTLINEHFGNTYSDVDTYINRIEDKNIEDKSISQSIANCTYFNENSDLIKNLS